MITLSNEGIQIIGTGHKVPLTSLASYTNFSAIAAAGRSIAVIGKLVLAAGTGSKTISSAGGKIYIGKIASRTFANAGSTLRIGIQDVTAGTGLEDGVFDVGVRKHRFDADHAAAV